MKMTEQQTFFEDVQPGTELVTREYGPLTVIDTVRWAGLQENTQQLHYDRDWVREHAGLRTFIASGAYRQALLMRMLTDWAGPRGRLRKLSLRHTYSTFEGEPRFVARAAEKSAALHVPIREPARANASGSPCRIAWRLSSSRPWSRYTFSGTRTDDGATAAHHGHLGGSLPCKDGHWVSQPDQPARPVGEVQEWVQYMDQTWKSKQRSGSRRSATRWWDRLPSVQFVKILSTS